MRLAEAGLQQFGLQAVDDIKGKPRIFGYQLCWHAVGLHAAGISQSFLCTTFFTALSTTLCKTFFLGLLFGSIDGIHDITITKVGVGIDVSLSLFSSAIAIVYSKNLCKSKNYLGNNQRKRKKNGDASEKNLHRHRKKTA